MNEKFKGIAGIVITVLVLLLAAMMEWQDMGPEFVRWAGRAFALLVALSNALGFHVNTGKVKP